MPIVSVAVFFSLFIAVKYSLDQGLLNLQKNQGILKAFPERNS